MPQAMQSKQKLYKIENVNFHRLDCEEPEN